MTSSSVLFYTFSSFCAKSKQLNKQLNKLSLNITKTNFMLFKSSSKKITKQLNIKIKDHYITQVKSTKFLGTIVDDQLKWKEHINFIANKISRLTGILCKARHFVTRSLLKSIYYALIYPYIFMAMLYGLMHIRLISRIIRIRIYE